MTEHAHEWLPIPDTNAYVCVCGMLGIYASGGPAPWSGRFGASISDRTLSDAVRAVRAATIRECAEALDLAIGRDDATYDAHAKARAAVLALLEKP